MVFETKKKKKSRSDKQSELKNQIVMTTTIILNPK